MNPQDLNDLKAEFDQFVREKCESGECLTSEEGESDTEPVPAFVDELSDRLLAPYHSGVYFSRLDIKRVAEAIDESIPISERKRMIKALFRHTVKKAYLRAAFDEFNRHFGGRILIYRELSEAFPASKAIFDANIDKIKKTQKMLDQIVEDFEEIEPTDDPMMV
ncbi:hypothetical protein [Sulfuricurvum sp.]|uniref:hypothetical protein n=1 Tax=Sulfuricurvum sp. TaxID=2025608 RepID=UPI00260929E5|nr:hypothetical protein [Sulfuricurvum sp.]MDD2837322.1 hypothetical protein [Sulfuricurvum sp.]MDD3595795.1 hypothetical protein [Sulfuricurvum sp.]MDD4884348.1 hypothetical protein [Sulfuricurvum sp.]